MNPSAQILFPNLKDVPLEQLRTSRSLFLHARRVMTAVENAVSSMDDTEVFVVYLRELGGRHAHHLMKTKLFDVSSKVCNACWIDMQVSLDLHSAALTDVPSSIDS